MRIINCLHTQSDCYKEASKIVPTGIVVHSTGANNTSIARYSQPSDNDPNRTNLYYLIGTNKYGNSWNRSGVSKAVHYIIGKLADGTVATVYNIPENYACWGCGKGSKGSYNYAPVGRIQLEVCEDDLNGKDYFNAIFKEATELCADICHRYGWSASAIASHKEAHAQGYASNHGDIDHWLSWHNKTMNDFRAEVQRLLDEMNAPKEPEAPSFEPYGAHSMASPYVIYNDEGNRIGQIDEGVPITVTDEKTVGDIVLCKIEGWIPKEYLRKD